MKTITIKLYDYDELSTEAKEKAHYDYIMSGPDEAQFWLDECVASIKAGIEYFGYTLNNYEINLNILHARIEITGEDEPASSYGDLMLSAIDDKDGCPFTGVCYDEHFLDPIRNFLKKTTDITMIELLEQCAESAIDDIRAENELAQTEDHFADLCKLNEWTFEEDGTIHN